MILFITADADDTANRVADCLQARGANFLRFDPGLFPIHAQMTKRFTPQGELRQWLRMGERTIDLREVRVAWSRRPAPPRPHDEISDERTRSGVVEESLVFLRDLWETLDCVWLPGPYFTVRRAEMKGLQLKVAGQIGFELPSTSMTNSPDDFLDLYREQMGRVLTKRVMSRPLPSWGNEVRYAEPVSTRDMGYVDAVRFSPIIAQAYVPKSVELRVTVIGKQVFTSEIQSQATYRTRHDWKRYDLENTAHVARELPRDVAAKCVELVEALGLRFGTIDLVETPDGSIVFLELNPNGQYLWVEELAKLPISEALADYLIALDSRSGD